MSLTDRQHQFSQYLTSIWSEGFEHRYPITRHTSWGTWREKSGSVDEWWCHSLGNASANYSWPENLEHGSFNDIAIRLQVALKSNDNQAAAKACFDVFSWGGVARRPQDASRRWVERRRNDGQLAGLINEGVSLLGLKVVNDLARFDGDNLLMNSAMTKVYTAADVSGLVVMYDGRVGAALGLLVRHFLSSVGVNSVPEDLAFRWGAPTTQKAAKLKVRDPSSGGFRFMALPNSSTNAKADFIRADIARTTGRILSAVVNDLKGSGIDVSMTDIERALFMIGYDVRSLAKA